MDQPVRQVKQAPVNVIQLPPIRDADVIGQVPPRDYGGEAPAQPLSEVQKRRYKALALKAQDADHMSEPTRVKLDSLIDTADTHIKETFIALLRRTQQLYRDGASKEVADREVDDIIDGYVRSVHEVQEGHEGDTTHLTGVLNRFARGGDNIARQRAFQDNPDATENDVLREFTQIFKNEDSRDFLTQAVVTSMETGVDVNDAIDMSVAKRAMVALVVLKAIDWMAVREKRRKKRNADADAVDSIDSESDQILTADEKDRVLAEGDLDLAGINTSDPAVKDALLEFQDSMGFQHIANDHPGYTSDKALMLTLLYQRMWEKGYSLEQKREAA